MSKIPKDTTLPKIVRLIGKSPHGKEVFITIPINQIDIVYRDNSKSFNPETHLPLIEDLEFYEIFEQ